MNVSLNWEFYKLSEIATFRRGSFPQPYGLDKWYDDENGFPFVQVFDVGDNMRLKNTTKRRISSLAGEQSVFVEKGTIILTIQGSIGRIAITHYDTYIDRTLLIFQSFKLPTDKKFFMYVVHRLFEDEKKRAHGSTIATITKEQLSSFVIPLPPLPEQQKIAEILSTVDAKIEVIDQQIAETQALKKGLMQRLLTKGIGHTEFKDSPLGEIPKCWEVVKLEKLIKLKSGDGLSKSEMIEGNYPVYGGNGITFYHGKFNYEESKLIIGRVGAKCGCIHRTEKISWITDNALIIDKSLKEHDTFFLEYILRKIDLNQYANKNAQPVISGGKIYPLVIPFPPIQEQTKIAEILNSVDEKMNVLSEKKTHYQELKQGLMQQLLTGKIRVKID
jgi:type I restriction enzyme S subunit